MSITVNLPKEVEAQVTAGAARRGVSPEQVAAEAIEARFTPVTTGRRRRYLAFAAIGTSTNGRTASDTDEILAEGFGQH